MTAELGNLCGTVVAVAALIVPCHAVYAGADLLSVYKQAVQSAPQYQSAVASVGLADADYRHKRAAFLPHFDVNAGVFKNETGRTYHGLPSGAGFIDYSSQSQDTYTARLQLDQTLFDWAAWQSGKAAFEREKAAQLRSRASAQDLMVRVTRAYFSVLSARDAVSATRKEKAVNRRQLTHAQVAFKANLIPDTSVMEIRSALDAATVDQITNRNELEKARAVLTRITGKKYRRIAVLDTPANPQRPQDLLRVWQHRARKNSLVLRAARHVYQSAKREIAAVHGRRFPHVSLVGRLGESKQTAEFPLPTGSSNINLVTETRAIGIQVSLPLFLGGSIKAVADKARFVAEKKRQALIKARRYLAYSVRTAYNGVEAAVAQIRARRSAIRSGEKALAAAKAGLRSHTRDVLEVMQAQENLLQRRADYKKAWYVQNASKMTTFRQLN